MSASAIEFLFSLEKFGMKLGLATMARLCEALGHPERQFASIHVAGTNGKGSVTAMVDTALRQAGYRAARYTSPHLVRVEERFVIDGREVATADLEAAAARVKAIVDGWMASGAIDAPPTFFECTTAVAFDLFARAGVEIATIEVGLGGRLDATNVIDPLVCAIVSIDFDHQAQLGTTVESIAFEKAGIVKPGVPVVCGPLPSRALDVIAATCAERHAPLVRADEPGLLERIARLPRGLDGAHQIANAAVAWRVLELVDRSGRPVGGPAMAAGLADARWPGRLEHFTAAGHTVIVDAAHNPAGASALTSYLRERDGAGGTLVFGAMRDKDVTAMLRILAPAASEIICTSPTTPRAMPAAEVAMLASEVHPHVTAIDDPDAALDVALTRARPVVIAGSIFLIGPLRERLARGILR